MRKFRFGIIIVALIGVSIYFLFIREVLYRPSFNASPLYSLDISKQIDTVLDLPYTEVLVKNGVILDNGAIRKDQIKEIAEFDENNCEILVLRSSEAALDYFLGRESSITSGFIPRYQHAGSNGNQYFVTYLKQFRSAHTGLPSGRYTCKALFLKSNMVIEFSFYYQDPKTTTYNDDVGKIAELLSTKSSK